MSRHLASNHRPCRAFALSILSFAGSLALLSAEARADRSYVGEAIVEALADQHPDLWSVSDTNSLAPWPEPWPRDWLVQTPPTAYWNQPRQELPLPVPCTDEDKQQQRCNLDFGLRTCEQDDDCAIDGRPGRCHALLATMKSPDDEPASVCVGHSDEILLDGIFGLISSAQRTVDVTTWTLPDGRFVAAMQNAIAYLHSKGADVRVRVLFGKDPSMGLDGIDAVGMVENVLRDLTADLPADSPVTVYVGTIQVDILGPNHSKIVAVDGREALVGGHNMLTTDYLRATPVHDLSIRVAGPAARHAHTFADVLWRYVCKWSGKLRLIPRPRVWRAGRIAKECPSDAELPTEALEVGNATVISAGRLAISKRYARQILDGNVPSSNPSDIALDVMIRAATDTIRISQQDLGSYKWSAHLDAIVNRLTNGVKVWIVVSNRKPFLNGKAQSLYANPGGNDHQAIAREIARRLKKRFPGDGDQVALQSALCRLRVAPLRYSEDENDHPPANHSKMLMVDDIAFYVGSQNLYPWSLPEYGYIVDDGAAATHVRNVYWGPLWRASRHSAWRHDACEPSAEMGDPL